MILNDYFGLEQRKYKHEMQNSKTLEKQRKIIKHE